MADRESPQRNAYTTALILLGARELSEAQLRSRLLRRRCDPEDVEQAIARLKNDRTLDDRRVAGAAARLEATIRHRGPTRVLQKVRQLGIDATIAQGVVDELFADVDATALLDRAIARRIKGASPASLDRRATAKLVRALVAQGFRPSAIYKRLRAQGTTSADEE